jgi:hypothetical protein
LRKAIGIEKKKVIAEQRIKRALDDKFPSVAEAPNEVNFDRIIQTWNYSFSPRTAKFASIVSTGFPSYYIQHAFSSTVVE